MRPGRILVAAAVIAVALLAGAIIAVERFRSRGAAPVHPGRLALISGGQLRKRPPGNVGDLFTYPLGRFYAAKSGTRTECVPMRSRPRLDGTGVCLVGSILQWLPGLIRPGPSARLLVMGCGLIRPERFTPPHWMEVLGVRGHLTSELVQGAPPVVGDPGLLMSRLFPDGTAPVRKIGIILHEHVRKQFESEYPHLVRYVIEKDKVKSYAELAALLKSCQRVASSSLHGVVFCHSYGIPVRAFKLPRRGSASDLIGADFKFRDYYSALDHDFRTREVLPPSGLEEFVDEEWQPRDSRISSICDDLEQRLSTILGPEPVGSLPGDRVSGGNEAHKKRLA